MKSTRAVVQRIGPEANLHHPCRTSQGLALDTGVILWPRVDGRLALWSSDSAATRVEINAGTRSSLHSGWTGSDGPSGERWYESDVYAGLNVGWGPGMTVGTTFTRYTSPNNMFTPVNELTLKVALDDRSALGRRLLRPYALAAFELVTRPGLGQLDGGLAAGKYLELGVSPGHAARFVTIAVPLKPGLSLGDYYELAGRDRRFGLFSAAGIVTVPIGRRTTAGAWNVRGAVEYQALGEMTRAMNAGKDSKAIGAIGVEWSLGGP
ncbi:MAG: hypothetical protein HY657_11495 [Acidobacteria bacterium]|nr:hypothetical protein [Acidobacteriota bacterium]